MLLLALPKLLSTPETVEGALSRSSYPMHIKTPPTTAEAAIGGGRKQGREMRLGLEVAFSTAPPATFCISGRGGFTFKLPPTFQGLICLRFDPLPYFRTTF